jgi:putative transposase
MLNHKEILQFEQARLHGILGYRRMKHLLQQKHQRLVNGKKLCIIMREVGAQAVIRRKKHKTPNRISQESRIVGNVLKREFATNSLGKKYVTDITYIPIPNSMVYVSVILDLFNNEIVTYKISQSLDRSLSIDVIKKLAAKRSLDQVLIHSDQGIHYTNQEYHQLLQEKNIIQSMSRRGNCWDNAMAENFFSHFKCECIKVRKRSLRSFLDVVEASEKYFLYYNGERTQKKLKGMSPVAFRQQFG